ncbi:MAG: hypothetical protein AAB603_03215 [Patescibacteria group bacterium]
MFYIKNRFKNISLAYPKMSFTKKMYFVIVGRINFFISRLKTLLFLFFGFFPYKTRVYGKETLDECMRKNGAIFISVHSGSYPMAGKIFHDNYPDHKIITPFYKFNKYSIYETYKKLFKRININIVQLGGAMKEIDPVLTNGGSVCLFLDAALPVKNSVVVKIFKNPIPLSTGALWLSKKYSKPIIPIYVQDKKQEIILNVLPEIKISGKNDDLVMKEIALSIENMISITLRQWHIADNFFFQDLV